MTSRNPSESLPADRNVGEKSLPGGVVEDTPSDRKKSRCHDNAHMEYYGPESPRDPDFEDYTVNDVHKSDYYRDYVKDAANYGGTKRLKTFKTRFHLPFEDYLEFVKDAKEGHWFPDHENEDAPLEIFILGSLRYLAGSLDMDELGNLTGVPHRFLRVFFTLFLKVCRMHRCVKWSEQGKTKALAASIARYSAP
jgi:hypothetical protein